MVYSTCTEEPEEDEEVITWLLDHNPGARLEPITLDITRSPAVKEWEGKTYHKDIENVLRLYPQDNDTEGFFVAKLRKA